MAAWLEWPSRAARGPSSTFPSLRTTQPSRSRAVSVRETIDLSIRVSRTSSITVSGPCWSIVSSSARPRIRVLDMVVVAPCRATSLVKVATDETVAAGGLCEARLGAGAGLGVQARHPHGGVELRGGAAHVEA